MALSLVVSASQSVSYLGLHRMVVIIPLVLIALVYGWHRYDSLEGASPEVQLRLVFKDRRLWFILFLTLIAWIGL